MKTSDDDYFKLRKKKFTWQSKLELYEYFKEMYDLDCEAVDNEIEQALNSFKIRKGQPIDTKELWQKVGNEIEHRLTKPKEPTEFSSLDDALLENEDTE